MINLLKDYEYKLIEKISNDLDTAELFVAIHNINYAAMYVASAKNELLKLCKVRLFLREFGEQNG